MKHTDYPSGAASADALHHQLQAISYILKYWKKNLALARQQIEEGGSQASGHFANIIEQLSQAVSWPTRADNKPGELRANGQSGLESDISGILEALQYHDRVNQVIGHVEQDIDRMLIKLDEISTAWSQGHSLPEIELESWLERLQCSYSTREQKNIHNGLGDSSVSGNAPTFF